MGRTRGSEAGNLSVTKRGLKGGKDRGAALTAKSGFEGPLNAPWRKTVSIFKQPVTLVHTTSRETKSPTNDQLRRVCANSNVKNKADKPRQVSDFNHFNANYFGPRFLEIGLLPGSLQFR